jgi:hypothetical protein
MCANAIDGNLVMGSITVGSVSLAPGGALIGKVQIEDGAGPTELNISAGAAEAMLSTADANSSTQVVTGAVSILLLAANAARRVAVLTNLSITPGEIVYIGGPTIAVGDGIPVGPGESYEDTQGGTAWHGVAAAGTPAIAVYEAEKV